MPRGGQGRGFFGGWGRIWFEGFLLLHLAEQPSHGYDLAGSMEKLGFLPKGVGAMGRLYRILGELENRGWIRGEWKTEDGGAAKKEYQLTSMGWHALQQVRQRLQQMKQRIETFESRMARLSEHAPGNGSFPDDSGEWEKGENDENSDFQ